MTFTIEGEDTDNQIEVSQSAADDKSELRCTPACPPPPPPEEYSGIFIYYGGDNKEKKKNPAQDFPEARNAPTEIPKKLNKVECPGGSLKECVKVCPTNGTANEVCVEACNLRCS